MGKPTVFLGFLTVLASAIGVAAVGMGAASTLEAISFATGAICVWLVVRENIWNFPIGIINVATFSVVFFQSKLYADAGLQLVYLLLGIMGWIMWLRKGEGSSNGSIGRVSAIEWIVVLLLVGVSTVGLWRLLHLVGGSASFFDALTTSISLAAQWMLNRKQLENWILWIIVDIIYVPLYLSKELYLTSALYAVFLCMAIVGWLQWQQTWRLKNQGSLIR